VGFIVIHTGRAFHLTMLVKLVVSILVLIVAFICIIVPYWDTISPHGLSQPVLIAYQAVNRTLWSAVIGWLVFLCSTGNVTLINKILSWPIFVPLARLNYAAYLIHSMIIYVMAYNLIEPIPFQPHVLVQLFISNTFLSYTVAIAVVLLFEAPFFAIEKKLFKH
jgi:peptidoglycan/LPS O-acetylase OafA/YrhL